MKYLKFRKDFPKIREVQDNIASIIPDTGFVKTEFFFSLRKHKNVNACNFSLYYSDRIADLYNNIIDNYSDVVVEVGDNHIIPIQK